ncbi:MAG TPA: DUF3040 domain-containing protein [Gemmatimonadales bacterium]|nr:DUF3040 domain-containing protein [Gemmatimonadales bacterium]
MTPELFLQLGGAAVFGAFVMAVVLIRYMRPSKPAPEPTVEHFNEACDDLLPLYIADYPGMPLGDDEENAIREIERGLEAADPKFLAKFEKGEQ